MTFMLLHADKNNIERETLTNSHVYNKFGKNIHTPTLIITDLITFHTQITGKCHLVFYH